MIRIVRRAAVVALSLALTAGLAPAASGHGVSGGPLGPQQVDGTAGTVLDAATQSWCDPIDPAACLLPFPNDHFTRADSSATTGKRLDLQPQAMPRNIAGKPIDPTEWNRNDGFSPGQLIVAKVPGLSADQTDLPPVDDPEFSMGVKSAVVVINAETGRRHPVWAELDSSVDGTYGGGDVEGVSPPETDPLHDPENGQALLVRPAINWEENTRYVVVLQNMLDDRGQRIPASPVFGAYRDGTPTPLTAFEERRPHFQELFRGIDDHQGPPIERGDIFLAWDFTTASADNLAGRLLHMRDDAFRSLEGGAPTFEVTAVTENPDSNVSRRIEGEFQVPRYVSTPTPGARMVYDPVSGQPMRQPTDQPATFTCNLPPPSVDGEGNLIPATVSLYGHGLLGGQSEVNSNAQREFGELENVAFCATDWLGMSTLDLATIAAFIIPDLSNFHLIPDRSQQGILSFLFLGEMMRHPEGFAAHPAFQDGNGEEPGNPLIDPDSLVYYGNSQGGIMGGAVAAVAHNLERAVLGVPGMNYSTLLRRSKDFDPFAALIYLNYTDELDRSVIFSLMQTLWDRGEANAYAHHMSDDPYPCPDDLCDGPTPHRVLLHVAFGDHQVANVSAEVEARTIGAAVHEPPPPAYNAWNQPPQTEFPMLDAIAYDGNGEYDGSAMMVWDSGTPTPPFTNTPPRAGNDPHETPRRDREARRQMAHFFRTGSILDVCSGSSGGGIADGSCQTAKRDG